ncbi:MAG: ArsR/SmtB family transcription factor [Anaerolineae bacterium]
MDIYQKQVALLKLLAHPLRLQILDILRSGDECVCHLAAALNKPQPYISQQLAILRKGGALVDHREGTNIFYRLTNENVRHLVEAACGPASVATSREPAHGRLAGCHCPKCTDLTTE